MKSKMNSRPLLACAFTVCMATGASAATYFSDPLTSDTGNFTPGDGSGEVTYGTGGIVFAGEGDGGRRYVATTDSTTATGNYSNVAFTASMKFVISSTAGATTMYLGIGAGDVGNPYAQPDQDLGDVSGAWVGWDIRDLSGTAGRIVAKTINNGTPTDILAAGETPFSSELPAYGGSDAVHLATMAWNPITREMTWTLDIDNDGTVNETVSTIISEDIVSNWNDDGHDSKIFFGGSNSVTVSDFSVIPEPSVALLGGLGMLGSLRRRRP